MSTVTIDLDEGLATLLHQTNENVELAASEMIVLELYRRGAISSGKAGELLGMPRLDFIRHASELGIPAIDMTEEEWEHEKATVTAWLES
jgi:predicted HTH domain antitoxin